MLVKIFKGFWKINDIVENRNFLFIFGDNDVGLGWGGQAIIRDERNTIGIPTKKYPSYNKDSYYYDKEYEENIKKIDLSIEKIINVLKDGNYEGIVLPEDGFGTGLAKLDTYAPKTLEYLKKKIIYLKKIVKKL